MVRVLPQKAKLVFDIPVLMWARLRVNGPWIASPFIRSTAVREEQPHQNVYSFPIPKEVLRSAPSLDPDDNYERDGADYIRHVERRQDGSDSKHPFLSPLGFSDEL